MLGVIACPITSGDTAFRSARLTLADWFGVQQKEWGKRLAFAVPLLAVGGALSQINFNIVWRYFSWTNQTLAVFTLWAATVYLFTQNNTRWGYIVTLIPALFMTMVSVSYILIAPEGFHLAEDLRWIGYAVAAATALFLLVLFIIFANKNRKSL
jgi:carbon starvation protein CstA